MERIPVTGIVIFLAMALGLIGLFAWVLPPQPDWVYVSGFLAFCLVWYIVYRVMND